PQRRLPDTLLPTYERLPVSKSTEAQIAQKGLSRKHESACILLKMRHLIAIGTKSVINGRQLRYSTILEGCRVVKQLLVTNSRQRAMRGPFLSSGEHYRCADRLKFRGTLHGYRRQNTYQRSRVCQSGGQTCFWAE